MEQNCFVCVLLCIFRIWWTNSKGRVTFIFELMRPQHWPNHNSYRLVILMVNSTHIDLQHILSRGCWGQVFEAALISYTQNQLLSFIKLVWSSGMHSGLSPRRPGFNPWPRQYFFFFFQLIYKPCRPSWRS